jgi:AraC-like DNA-binding protein
MSEINRANEAILRQVRQNFDSRMKDIEKLSMEFSISDKVIGLMNSRKPLDENTRYLISTFVNKDLKTSGITNELINDIYIYFKRGDFIVRPGAYYEKEQAYDDFYKESSFSYEEWQNIIVQRYFKKSISIKENNKTALDQINYIQTIGSNTSDNYANVVFILKPDNFLEALNSVEWINNGYFFILDKNDEIVLSNVSDNKLAVDFNYKEYKGEYGSMKSKNNIVSYIKSENMEWVYVSVIPSIIFLEKAAAIKNFTLTAFFVCMLLGIILSLLFSRKNYVPINELFATIMTKKIPSNKKVPEEFRIIQQSIYDTLLEKDKLTKALNNYTDELRSNFLVRLLKGKLYEDEYQEEILDYYNINLQYEDFMVIMFKIESLGKFKDKNSHLNEREIQQYCKFVVFNVMQEVLGCKYLCYMTEVDDFIVSILNFPDIHLLNRKEEINEILYNGKNFIKDKFDILLTIAISNTQKSKLGIPIAYQQALETLEYKLVRGKGEMMSYDDIVKAKANYSYSLQTELHLINNLKIGNINQSIEIIDAIFVDFCKSDNLSLDIIKINIIDLISTIIKVVNELEIKYEEIFSGEFINLKNILAYDSVDDFRELIKDIVIKICVKIQNSKKSHNDILKDAILEFVNKNYDRLDLSNTVIAEHFNISTAYLSRFFKEQTGESLLEFINKTRLEHAKSILVDEKCTIEDTAKKVGFYNDIALIRIFKKYEGITPGKYKEKIIQENN